MLEKTITNQYNLKQKHNKLKRSLSALFIMKKVLPFAVTLPLLNSSWNNIYTKKNVKFPHVFLK
jgi:hypothetical protein